MSQNSRRYADNEEPEIGFEESIPLDGEDPVGEKMIDELDQNKPAREQTPPAPAAEPMPRQFPAS